MYQNAPLVLRNPEGLMWGHLPWSRRRIRMATWFWPSAPPGLAESDERLAGPDQLPSRTPATDQQGISATCDLAAAILAIAERPPVAASAGNSAAGGLKPIGRVITGGLAGCNAQVTTLAGTLARVRTTAPACCEDTEAFRS